MSESPSLDFHRPLVISGPSGVGKSTLLRHLFAEFPERFELCVSHTTRSPRPGEIDGIDYHFVTRNQFQDLIDADAFIERADFAGNRYGTTQQAVSAVQDKNRRCILDIEAQGVQEIKRRDLLKPVYLFICPQSMEVLRSRLLKRGTESEASAQKRLEAALSELNYFKQPDVHDFAIVNDVIERAYDLFKTVALGRPITSDILPLLDN